MHLFRIDKSFLPPESHEQNVVILPHFEEMLKMKNDEPLPEDYIHVESELGGAEFGSENDFPQNIYNLEEEAIDDLLVKKQMQLNELMEQIKNAKNQSEEILELAKQDALKLQEDAQKEGYEKGFDKGYQEGILAIDNQRATEQGQFEETLAKVIDAKKDMYSHVENGLLDLAVSISQKIIDVEINKNDVVYKQLVRRTLTMLKNQSNVVLHVNKADYEKYFENMNGAFLEEITQSDIKITQDISLKPNDIFVTTDYGNVNSGIKTQLQQIENLLRNA